MAHIICNRRRFLGGLAAGLMATPFLPRFAGAGTEPLPQRIVFVFTPNGTVYDGWLGWNAQGGQVTEHDIAGMDFGEILAPLEDYRQSMLVLRGINMESAYDEPRPKDHWPDYMGQLTAIQPTLVGDQQGEIAGISIDQVIAQEWARNADMAFDSVRLGMGVRTGGNRVVSAAGAGQPLRPNRDPYDVFQTMFADLDLAPAEAAKLRARRGRVLDAVTDELRSAECQLAGEDRIKLQKHLESIVQLQDSLDASVEACTLPTIEDGDPNDEHRLPEIIEQQFLNLTTMFSCDLTRVATVMMGDSQMVHDALGHQDSHHNYSHDRADAQLRQIDGWYAARIKAFLDQLRAIPEGDGTMFDNTLVIWCHEQSKGSSHLRRDMPYVLFGGDQIMMDKGKVIHAGGNDDHHDPQAWTVNDLWISVANRMGVDLTTFGDHSHVHGPLPFL